MNSDKQTRPDIRGNALIYVLLALALLGGLTMILAKQSSEESDTSYERNELLVTKMVAYAASAKQVVDQMMMTGTTPANINLERPQDTNFDTPPFTHKVYHPDGGGLSYQDPSADIFITATDIPLPGWYFSDEMNVDWTPTTANDIVLVAYRIQKSVCEAINKKITGSTNIPALPSGMAQVFLTAADGGGGSNLDVAACADCEGYPSMCVSNVAQDAYSYYNIIVAQ